MDFFISVLGRFFKKKKHNNVLYNISTTKHSIGAGCTLKFSVETEKKKKEINEKLKNLVTKYIKTPEKLIQYMELKGCKVYKVKNANKLLQKIGEEEGFLTPLKGFKAFLISLVIGIFYEHKFKLNFSTNEMFIFNTGEIEIYTIARALHKYYGYRNNLPGFDYKSQEIFKRVYNKAHNGNTSPFVNMNSLKDMYACKEAIARDIESINFTIELSIEYERAKKALNKLQTANSTNI